ncbi:MAG: S8 family serine peptidase, partial [Gemmatimonas sp.]
GNETTDSDITPNYPSGYTSPNIISVASTTRTDGLSSFSNYGATTVDLAAPGSEIYSTTPGNTYQSFSGTSMATPHVAGACALLKAYRDSLSHSEIKDLLMQSVDIVPALSGRCITGGRINLHRALLASGDLTTSPGGGLSASGPMGGPLTPNSITYTLTNRGTSNVAWSASADATWVSLSSSGEIVPPGGNSTLTVQLSAEVAALPGGRHTAHVTITNVTSSTTQTRLVELDILPPVVISEPLNDNPNWLTTGEWEFGTPTGQGGAEHGQPDPSTGASGANVYGVNLSGDYSITPGGPFYVTAGPFDLSLQDSTRLEFQRWLNTDMPNWVTATLEVSSNGTTWTQLFVNSGEVADSSWTPQSFDISAVADLQPQVWLRWGYQVKNLSDVWAYSGWNIDDIVIRGVPVNNIALVLPPDLTEGDAPVAATLVMTPVPSSPAVVTLVSANPAQLQVPASVTVPAGSASVPVLLTAVDDALADGTQTIGITASSPGFPDRQVSLAVHDNETRVITVALPSSLSEGAGAVAGVGTVSLDAPAGAAVRVFLE